MPEVSSWRRPETCSKVMIRCPRLLESTSARSHVRHAVGGLPGELGGVGAADQQVSGVQAQGDRGALQHPLHGPVHPAVRSAATIPGRSNDPSPQ